MTGKEAIRLIQAHMIAHSIGVYPHIRLAEALDMAISALRAQQTIHVTDLYDEDGGGVYRVQKASNDPLTMAELRQMDGEPVWIKLFDQDEEFWVLRNEWVDTRNPEPLILFHMRWYSHADYGNTWMAYRRKPEEGTK